MKNVIIIGAGGHGRVAADAVLAAGNRVLGFLDDVPKTPEETAGLPWLGPVSHYKKYEDAEFLIAIGDAAARRRIAEALEGPVWHTAIHPAAVVSKLDVEIGPGTLITAGAIVNPGARIGCHCIINTAAVVEHDCRVGDFSHVSVGAKLAGNVSLGENTWVGIGAAVSNGIRICGSVTLGAGAAAVRDITEPGTYVGVPAGRLR